MLQAAQAGNTDYGAATATQSFQVTPAPLTVTASNATRAFGTANPAFSGTITGAVGSDSFSESFTTTRHRHQQCRQLSDCALRDWRTTGQLHRHHRERHADGDRGSDHDHIDSAGQRDLRRQRHADRHRSFNRRHARRNSYVLERFHSARHGHAERQRRGHPEHNGAARRQRYCHGQLCSTRGTLPPVLRRQPSITVNGASQTITFPAIASRVYGSAPFAVTATRAWAAVIRSRLTSSPAQPR